MYYFYNIYRLKTNDQKVQLRLIYLCLNIESSVARFIVAVTLLLMGINDIQEMASNCLEDLFCSFLYISFFGH